MINAPPMPKSPDEKPANAPVIKSMPVEKMRGSTVVTLQEALLPVNGGIIVSSMENCGNLEE
jgi:hypothetical protein